MRSSQQYVFSYGTLQFPQVQQQILGRIVPMIPDQLVGFELQQLQISDPQVLLTSGQAVHPILVHTGRADHIISGQVLAIEPSEIPLLDAYEVSDYHRIAVTLASGIVAWVYVRKQT